MPPRSQHLCGAGRGVEEWEERGEGKYLMATQETEINTWMTNVWSPLRCQLKRQSDLPSKYNKKRRWRRRRWWRRRRRFGDGLEAIKGSNYNRYRCDDTSPAPAAAAVAATSCAAQAIWILQFFFSFDFLAKFFSVFSAISFNFFCV